MSLIPYEYDPGLFFIFSLFFIWSTASDVRGATSLCVIFSVSAPCALCIYPWASSAVRTLMITMCWLLLRGDKALIPCFYLTRRDTPRCRAERMRAAEQQHSRQALEIRDDMKSELWRVLFPCSLQYVRQTGRNCVCLCCVIHEHIKCHLQNTITSNKCNIELSVI